LTYRLAARVEALETGQLNWNVVAIVAGLAIVLVVTVWFSTGVP
jgi:hypothetical protein